jgi:hypothetical protein
MGVPSDFAEMMLETVTVYPASTVDNYGKQAYSATGVAYRCRIMSEQRILRDREGRDIIEAGRAVIYGVATATVNDKILLPNGAVPLIVSVDTPQDEDGNHHTVIGFGA